MAWGKPMLLDASFSAGPSDTPPPTLAELRAPLSASTPRSGPSSPEGVIRCPSLLLGSIVPPRHPRLRLSCSSDHGVGEDFGMQTMAAPRCVRHRPRLIELIYIVPLVSLQATCWTHGAAW